MDYNFKGTYDSTQSYVVKDVVSYTQNNVMKFFFCLSPNDSLNSHVPDSNADSPYWGVINTSSNFPQKVDSFPFRVNIQGNDKTDIARINTLTLQVSLTTDEQNELNTLVSKHRNKLFLADDLNAIQDSLSNLQMFFKDKVDPKLTQNVADIQSARDEALNELDTKKASLDLYLDSTTAGALRTDLGVMTDLTTHVQSSLVNALNEINTNSYSRIPTDLNTATQYKDYYVNPNTPNAPSTNGGTLWVRGSSDGNYVTQLFMDLNDGSLYKRLRYSGTWQPWIKLASTNDAQMYKLTRDDGIAITFSGDLNSLFSPGRYYLSGNATNRPLNNTATGLLIVDQLVSSNGWFQKVITGSSGRTMIRYYTSGVWGNWIDYVLLTSDGILNIPTQPYFYANTGTDQTISSGVDTKVTLTSESNDVYNEFTSGTYTPKESGVYLISVSVQWLANVNGITTFKFYNGGSSVLNMQLGSNTKLAAFARPVQLTAGTPLSTYINQDSGASQTLDTMLMYITKLS